MYFITTVTEHRRPILVSNSSLLAAAVGRVKRDLPFEAIAWSVLPDHFHLVMNPGTNDPAMIIKRIKQIFGYKYRHLVGAYRGRVWQRRYWDHIIRDEADLNRHIDYIHYNPVKHGLVATPIEWPLSSFVRYQAQGVYPSDWGVRKEVLIDGDFGE